MFIVLKEDYDTDAINNRRETAINLLHGAESFLKSQLLLS
jgi:hypothetical protein